MLESGAAAVSHAGNILIRQSFPVLPRLPEAELQRVQENVLSLYINSRIELDSITLFISQPASDFFDQYQYNSSSAGMQTKPLLDQMHISFVKIVYFLFFFHNSCGILLSVISQIRV